MGVDLACPACCAGKCSREAAHRLSGKTHRLTVPMANQPAGQEAGPHVSRISGRLPPVSTTPRPPPTPNRMAIARALRRASPGNNPAASVPAVVNVAAPTRPAAKRQKVCQTNPACNPVASSASAVAAMPKANRRAGEMRRISSMVSTAPAK